MAFGAGSTVRAEGEGSLDLDAPVETDMVVEVRSGKMRNMDGLEILSGIYKDPCDGAVQVTEMGIEGDEHDYTFHGGVDKAIHAYCCAHYPTWRAEFPAAAERFVPGAFGENLVFGRMNERNVCIGDVVSVGPELVLQVSLPRQPCFKLNHRFRLKNFAPVTWRTSRTGWYYRVLRPGPVRAGDEVRLVERRHPKWTIERIQEYLHRDTANHAMNEELAAIEEFGAESGGAFRARVVKQQARERKKAAGDQPGDEKQQWREFRLVEKKRLTPRIMSFVLEAATALPGDDGKDEKDAARLDPGSHVKIRLGNGLVRSYSVVSGTKNRFELGVSFSSGDGDNASRGGSRHLHETAAVGDTIHVGRFTAGVPAASAASHRVFVAGGVGITAFLRLIEAMRKINYSVELHYAVRSADEVPYRDRLEGLGIVSSPAGDGKGGEGQGDGREKQGDGDGDRVVKIYDKSQGQRLDIRHIVRTLPWNSQLYFCGPRRMMDEALRETRAAGVDKKEVHFEAFEADVSGDPFEAVVVKSSAKGEGDDGKERERERVTLQVGAEETLLEVMQRRFGVDEVPSSCEVGNCGTCRLNLLEGRIDHRGTALAEDEKDGAMLACVSRGIGRIVVEI